MLCGWGYVEQRGDLDLMGKTRIPTMRMRQLYSSYGGETLTVMGKIRGFLSCNVYRIPTMWIGGLASHEERKHPLSLSHEASNLTTLPVMRKAT